MLKHAAGSIAPPARVLLVGRSGFLAQHLAAELEQRGIPFEAVGRPDIDLTSPTSTEALSDVVRPDDTVVILAALTPDKGRDVRTLMTNLRMAEHLAQVFDRCPCAHVVYISSDAVYDGQRIPIDENSGRQPVDLYALMHTSREMMLQSVLSSRNTPYCILRPVALFGSGDTHNSYGPNRFLREAFERHTITLFGNGEDERSHVYVNDGARLIAECVVQKSAGVLNIASPETVSFLDVAKAVRAACPFPATLIFKDRPPGAISRRPFAVAQLQHAFPHFEFTQMAAALKTIADARLKSAVPPAPTS